VLAGAHQQAAAAAEAAHGQRIRLRAAGGQDDVAGQGAESGGQRLPRRLQHAPRGAAGGVHGGRVPRQVHRRQGGLPRGGAERLGGVRVEVERHAYCAASAGR